MSAQQPPSQPSPQGGAPSSQSDDSMDTGIKVLIGCAIAVPVILFCGGILTALAVPAFVTYLNLAKVAEAEAQVQTISDEVRMHFEEHCEFPPELPATSDLSLCTSGELCAQKQNAIDRWTEAGLSVHFEPEMYFSYSTEIDDSKYYVISAEHDFTGSSRNHTVRGQVEADHDTCTAHVLPMYTENEFE